MDAKFSANLDVNSVRIGRHGTYVRWVKYVLGRGWVADRPGYLRYKLGTNNDPLWGFRHTEEMIEPEDAILLAATIRSQNSQRKTDPACEVSSAPEQLSSVFYLGHEITVKFNGLYYRVAFKEQRADGSVEYRFYGRNYGATVHLAISEINGIMRANGWKI